MAVAVFTPYKENNLIRDNIRSHRLAKRHYKKDSRFVLDLYTLTYDSHESLDSLGDFLERRYETQDVQNTFNDSRNIWLRRNKSGRNSTAYCIKRPSLQSRLQDGRNLQLYFVNEQSLDDESHIDDVVSLPIIFQSKCALNHTDVSSLPVENEEVRRNCYQKFEMTTNTQFTDTNNNTDSSYNVINVNNANDSNYTNVNLDLTRWSADIRDEVCATLNKIHRETCQQVDYRHRSDSPITCTIKSSLKKVGAEDSTHCNGRRRMNRHMLSRMNADQLQIIIDDLHSHVKYLNEQLMKMLMERDELHMSRDSLLVDIEDLNTYLGAKQVYQKSGTKFYNSNENNYSKNNNNYSKNLPIIYTKNLISGFNQLTSYIKN